MHNLRAGRGSGGLTAGLGGGGAGSAAMWAGGLPVQGTEGAGTRPADRLDAGRTLLCPSRPWNSPSESEGPSSSLAAGSCGLSWAWAPRHGEGLPRRERPGHPPPSGKQRVQTFQPRPSLGSNRPRPCRQVLNPQPGWHRVRPSGVPTESRVMGSLPSLPGQSILPLPPFTVSGLKRAGPGSRLGTPILAAASVLTTEWSCWPQDLGPWTPGWRLERGLPSLPPPGPAGQSG